MRSDQQKSHPFETRSPYECIHCFSGVRIVTLVTCTQARSMNHDRRTKTWRLKKLRVLSVRLRNVGVDHLRRIDDAVELFLCDKPQLERGLLEREVVVQRVVRNLRGLVIANDRRERGYQHQRAVHIFLDLLQIRFCSFDQKLAEVGASISQNRDGVRNVEYHQRLVDVHLQIAPSAAKADRYVISHYL